MSIDNARFCLACGQPLALQIAKQVENATIAFIVCDRGDRYLSTGVFPA